MDPDHSAVAAAPSPEARSIVDPDRACRRDSPGPETPGSVSAASRDRSGWSGASILAKLESVSPGGSVKDRIAVGMILRAESRGRIRPGTTIVELPAVHYETTGVEILAQTEGRNVAAFVACVGTGGTLTGVARRMRERFPGLEVWAVEPAESPVLSGGLQGPPGARGSWPASRLGRRWPRPCVSRPRCRRTGPC